MRAGQQRVGRLRRSGVWQLRLFLRYVQVAELSSFPRYRNQLNARKRHRRPRSNNLRWGLGFHRSRAIWRYASLRQFHRWSGRAHHLLSKRMLETVDAQTYYRSPTGMLRIDGESLRL
jgi:hypothetical protein